MDSASKKKILELFFLSAVSLYVELLIIRWMSADIRAFTVFRTFPLITCFVGLGVGFGLGNDKNYKYTPVAMILFALLVKLSDYLGLSIWGFPALGVWQWNNLSGMAPFCIRAAALRNCPSLRQEIHMHQRAFFRDGQRLLG